MTWLTIYCLGVAFLAFSYASGVKRGVIKRRSIPFAIVLALTLTWPVTLPLGLASLIASGGKP